MRVFRVLVILVIAVGPAMGAVPSVPTNVVATTTCDQVNLSWSPSQSSPALVGYRIFRNGILIFTNGTTTTFTDTNLLVTNYGYTVSAFNSSKESSPSAPAATAPCADSTAPLAPGSLTAAPAGCNQINLSWPRPSDGAARPYEYTSGLSRYEIYRGGTNAGNKIAEVLDPTLNYADSGVPGDTTIFYAIRVVDGSNNVSGFNISAAVTTPACLDTTPPTVPANLVAANEGCGQFQLSWSPSYDPGNPNQQTSGLRWYRLYRNSSLAQQVPATSATETGLAANAQYDYQVSAVDYAGNESASSPILMLVGPDCSVAAPGNFTISFADNKAVLRWSGTTGVLYQVESAHDPMGPWLPTDAPTAAFTTTNHALLPVSVFRVALFTNTPAYLANYPVNSRDGASPNGPATLTTAPGTGVEVELFWDAATDLGTTDAQGQTFTSGLDRYLIYRDGVFLKAEPATVTNSLDGSAVAAALYTYGVAAIDRAGNRSAVVTSVFDSCLFLEPTATVTGPDSTNESFLVSAAGCPWEASVSPTNNSWIELTGPTNGTGSANVGFIVEENPDFEDRIGTIHVREQVFRVTQRGKPCAYTVAPTSASAPTAGGPGGFNINTGGRCNWTASPLHSWIHTTSSGTGPGAVNYTVDANGGASLRSGTITVGGQLFTVNQAGLTCDFSISSNSASFSSVGGSGAVAVTTTVGCAWNTSNTNGWITITSGGSTNASGVVNYTVAPNGTINQRSGALVVAGQVFTVTQGGVGCSYSISSNSASYPAAGGAGSVNVTTSNGCAWSVVNPYGWITISSGSSGTNSGPVNFSVAANPATSSRSGTLTVAGLPFTVNQNSNRPPVANAGPDFSVTVTSNAQFNATGSSDPDGSISGYQWNFGDGNVASGFSVGHAYAATGVYTVTLTVTDNLGAAASDTATVTVEALPDLTPPSVTLTVAGSPNVRGVVSLDATASDNVSVSRVVFYRDGIGFATNNAAPYSTTFNTSALSNGPHTFMARAYDAANNSATSSVPVLVDNTAPTASLTSPASGSVVSNVTTLNATATDNAGGSGVARVEFFRDGGVFVGSVATAPFSYPCDTAGLANGNHGFYCMAYDAAGNSATSATNTVTVNNPPTVPGQFLWAIDIGNKTNNTQRATIHGVKADHQGNMLVAGDFNGTMDFGAGPVTSYSQDAFFAKYTALGQLVWFRHYGGLIYNVGNGIAVDSADNVIVTGYYSSTVDFGGGALTNAGNVDIFVVKFTSGGTHVWSKRFGAANSDVGYKVAVDGSNNVVVAGTFQYGVDFGGGVLTSAGSLDVFVAKYSGGGTHLWSKRVGGVNAEAVNGLALDGNGNVVMTGSFNGTVDFGGGVLTSAGGNDIFLVKYAGGNGNHVWSKRFGGGSGDVGMGVATDSAGNVVLCGQFTGGVDFGGGALVPTAPYSAIVLAKYGANGSFLWANKYGGVTLTDCPGAVTVDGGGNIVMTGYAQGMVDFGAGWLFSNGGKDTFVAKFTSGGAYQWAQRVNGLADDHGATITTDSQANIILAGGFQYWIDFGAGPFTTVTSGTDAYLARYAP